MISLLQCINCLIFLAYVHSIQGLSANRVGLNYSMVLVGGGLDDNNAEVWNRIIELGGGKGVARFGVISAAAEVRMSLFFNEDTLLCIRCIWIGSMLRRRLVLGLLPRFAWIIWSRGGVFHPCDHGLEGKQL